MSWEIICADVLDWAAEYDVPKFHALLCDPPYELGFMNKSWDSNGISFQSDTWAALAQHLHPGAWIMAFASSRGWHRLAVAMEDSGLIIQPSIFGWSNGQAFPKATRIDTQIDKRAGAKREIVGKHSQTIPQISLRENFGERYGDEGDNNSITVPATDLARAWVGHRYGGQVLKNALEPIICAQKPWTDPRLDCIVETGAGALNVDQARIGLQGIEHHTTEGKSGLGKNIYGKYENEPLPLSDLPRYNPQGRWPANFTLQHAPGCQRVGVRKVRAARGGSDKLGYTVREGENYVKTGTHETYNQFEKPIMTGGYADPDGTETVADWRCVPSCPVRKLGEQSGEQGLGRASFGGGTSRNEQQGGIKFTASGNNFRSQQYYDKGTAARFFYQSDWSYEIAERLALTDPVRYQAKASRRERDAGLDEMPLQYAPKGNYEGRDLSNPKNHLGGLQGGKNRNPHPTVKPIALTRWLATLLLPPPEYAPRRLLVPFAGTGSEAIGALLAGWDEVVMVDNNPEYCDIAEARTRWWQGWSEQAGTTEPKEILKAGKDQPAPEVKKQLELLPQGKSHERLPPH